MRQVYGIIYINLDHRTDRKEFMEKEFDRLGISHEKVHRLSGVYDRLNGTKGCMLSHIKALELAEEMGWEKTLILEDDALFIADLQSIESSLDLFYQSVGNDWDVYFLGGTYRKKEKTVWEGLYQIREGLAGHAYLIHRPYLSKLRACFASSYLMIKDHLFMYQSLVYSLDRVWVILQEADRWYALEQQAVIQRMMIRSDIDIVTEPLNRFLRVVYIDTGKEDHILGEFQRMGLDMDRVYRVGSHLEAAEKGFELGRGNTLIVEDDAVFLESKEDLDQKIIHFFRWIGDAWSIFLLDDQHCASTTSKHPYFRQVTRVDYPKIYAVNRPFYEPLIEHYQKGGSLNSFSRPSEWGFYCAPGRG